MYAIVDIETTGSKPDNDRIIEVGIVFHDGKQITGTYSSLINPEMNIPPFITGLTGITQDMVKRAPKFYEVAKDIVEKTEGYIFVAHNVRFDYSFIKKEFKDLGYNFQRKNLCTVRLARKFLPGLPSYSLGKLSANLGFPIKKEERHRALGDAMATALLLDKIIKENGNENIKFNLEQEQKAALLPPKLDAEEMLKLPNSPGVYYFKSEEGNILYIGKAINIRKRILQHFQVDTNSSKDINFKNAIAHIDFIETGSELIAELLESAEIKQHKPPFNVAQIRTEYFYGLYYDFSPEGIIKFCIKRSTNFEQLITQLSQKNKNKGVLMSLRQKYDLCPRFTDLYSGNGACFDSYLNLCKGACCGKETIEAYNERAMKAIVDYTYQYPSFFIIEKGIHEGEKSVVWVEQGIYRGYGYYEESFAEGNIDYLKTVVQSFNDNKDTRTIIRRHLKKLRNHQFITYDFDSNQIIPNTLLNITE